MLAAAIKSHHTLRRMAHYLLVISLFVPTIYYWFWWVWALFGEASFFAQNPSLIVIRHEGRLFYGGTIPVITPGYVLYNFRGVAFTLFTVLSLWWPEMRRRKLLL